MGMKYRIFSVLLSVLLLTGCTKAPNGKNRADLLAAAAAPFSFTGTVTVEGISQPVKLSAVKTANGLTVEMLEPEEVKGLTVEFGGETVKTTYRGLVMNLSPGDIPQQSVFIALRDVLSAVPDDRAEISESEGVFTISDKAGMLPYELLWSADDLALKAVKLPSMGGLIQVESFAKTQ